MRLFIAVRLSPGVIDRLRRLIAELRPKLPQARWVRPESSHWTLAFLGEVEAGRLDGVRRAMAAAAEGKSRFRLTLGGVGAFPGWKNPRVVWLGAVEGGRELSSLSESLRAELVRGGFALEERSFQPHLTLCRLASRAELGEFKLEAEPLAGAGRWSDVPMTAEAMELMESRLGPEGAVHTAVHRAALGGEGAA